MPGGMDSIGEQGPGHAPLEIDPQAGSGEPGMADRLVRACVAAMPAVEAPLPAAGAMSLDARADRLKLEGGSAAAVEQPRREAKHALHRSEQARMARRTTERPCIFV